MRHLARLFALSLLPALLGGCLGTHPVTTTAFSGYADPRRWACLPGRDDSCTPPPAVVEAHADGTTSPVPSVTADAGADAVDCFYLYPTVSMSLLPRNVDALAGDAPIAATVRFQAAPFQRACRVFAPRYRQATIATYALPEAWRQRYVQVALDDVLDAFDHYLAHHNQGRGIVLIGHSQGAELITRLLQARFEVSAELREHLLLAIIAGVPVQVPVGAAVGGTFAHLPLCRRAGEVGCVVTFKSAIDGSTPAPDRRLRTPPGQEAACVNPATLDDPGLSVAARQVARAPLRGTLLPPPAASMGTVQGDRGATALTRLTDAYSAACVGVPAASLRYLAIREEMSADDPRRAMAQFSGRALNGRQGLHVLDMQFPMAELVALVRARQPGRRAPTAVPLAPGAD